MQVALINVSMNIRLGLTLAASVYAGGILAALVYSPFHVRAEEEPSPFADLKPSVVADASLVERAYGRFRTAFLTGPDAGTITVPFGWSKGLCDGPKGTAGKVEFDFQRGSIRADVRKLTSDVDLWLVENVRGDSRSVAPESGDRFSKLGTVAAARYGSIVLEFDDLSERDLRPDLVLATPAGSDPATANALAIGMPGLFDRLVMREQARATETKWRTGLPLAIVGPDEFTAAVTSSPDPNLQDFVDLGEHLFFNETFDGNMRTCGTCHPASNNLTIDKEFIDTLPPTDPLFVAEFLPELIFEENGELRFENPDLMREFGLIVENLDGFGDLTNRFVMRSVSHVFAQGVSIMTPDEEASPPKHRIGWSGDGSPGQGSLREFAIGAVRQHFTLSMNREEGTDFRFPDDFELDALEAFQMALGRQEDYELDDMFFTDAGAEDGKGTFNDICGRCHANAGANSIATQAGPTSAGILPTAIGELTPLVGNGRFNTGVESSLFAISPELIEGRPRDGGFGVNPDGGTLEEGDVSPNDDGSFGDKTFNIPSVVEFADTAPGFHNHLTALTDFIPNNGGPGEVVTDHVEAAVRFYTTAEFLSSPSVGFSGAPELDDVPNIARFLRSINAVQNARDSLRFLGRALQLQESHPDVALEALTLAFEDAVDGAEVLGGADGLNLDALSRFLNAKTLIHETVVSMEAGMIPPGELDGWLTEPVQDLEDAQVMIFGPTTTSE